MIVRFHSLLVPTHKEQNLDTSIEYAIYLATKLDLPITFLHMVEANKPKTMVAAGDVRSTLVESRGMSYAQLEAVQKLEGLCDIINKRSNGAIKTDIIVESGRKWTNRIKIQQKKKRYLSILTQKDNQILGQVSQDESIARRLAKKTDSPTLLVPETDEHIPVGRTLFITKPNRINLPNFHQVVQIAKTINSEVEVLYLNDEYDFLTNAKINAFEIAAAKYLGSKGMKSHRLYASNDIQALYSLIDMKNIDMISMATSEQKMWLDTLGPDLSKRLISDMKVPLLLF